MLCSFRPEFERLESREVFSAAATPLDPSAVLGSKNEVAIESRFVAQGGVHGPGSERGQSISFDPNDEPLWLAGSGGTRPDSYLDDIIGWSLQSPNTGGRGSLTHDAIFAELGARACWGNASRPFHSDTNRDMWGFDAPKAAAQLGRPEALVLQGSQQMQEMNISFLRAAPETGLPGRFDD
jgi:hypothetical protein